MPRGGFSDSEWLDSYSYAADAVIGYDAFNLALFDASMAAALSVGALLTARRH